MTPSYTCTDTRCPRCAATFMGAIGLTGSTTTPSAGDLGVCICCAELLEFQNDLTLARLSARDAAALPMEIRQALLRAQNLVRRFNDEV
jgi:hypothetical protein